MSENVLQQVNQLTQMSVRDLQQRYCEVFGVKAAPNNNKFYLIRQVAFRLQEQAHKSVLSEHAIERMRSLLEDKGFNPDTGMPGRAPHARDTRTVQATPGTVIDREFHGRTYRVSALPLGKWEYNGLVYTSLSRIARLITGTNRSGPQFFGLLSASQAERNGRRNRGPE